MAIQINPVDFRGFSLGAPSLPNMPNIGALGLQAVQLKMGEQDAIRQAALKQAQMRQADEMALRQAGLEKDKMAQQGQQFNQNLNLEQRKMGLLEQKNAFDTQAAMREDERARMGFGVQMRGQDIQKSMSDQNYMQDLAKNQLTLLASKKKEDLDSLGAFAVQAKLGMSQAKNLSEAALLRNSIVDESVQNGFINNNMGQQLKKMPLSGFNNYLNYAVTLTDSAKQLKDLQPKEQGSGATVTLPDGTIIKTEGLTKPNQTEAQKEIKQAEDNISQLNKLLDVPDDYFGPKAARYEYLNPAAEWLGVKPSKEQLDQQEKYRNVQANSQYLALGIIKQLSGVQYSDKQLEFLKDILPSIGPGTVKSTFNGRRQFLNNLFENIKKTRQELLNQNVPIGSEQYNNTILDTMKNTVPKSNTEEDPLGLLK